MPQRSLGRGRPPPIGLLQGLDPFRHFCCHLHDHNLGVLFVHRMRPRSRGLHLAASNHHTQSAKPSVPGASSPPRPTPMKQRSWANPGWGWGGTSQALVSGTPLLGEGLAGLQQLGEAEDEAVARQGLPRGPAELRPQPAAPPGPAPRPRHVRVGTAAPAIPGPAAFRLRRRNCPVLWGDQPP